MPQFALSTIATAPVEEVWKLLHDPASFPRWWSGIETVRRDDADAYTISTDGYPDFPMAQQLYSEHVDGNGRRSPASSRTWSTAGSCTCRRHRPSSR